MPAPPKVLKRLDLPPRDQRPQQSMLWYYAINATAWSLAMTVKHTNSKQLEILESAKTGRFSRAQVRQAVKTVKASKMVAGAIHARPATKKVKNGAKPRPVVLRAG